MFLTNSVHGEKLRWTPRAVSQRRGRNRRAGRFTCFLLGGSGQGVYPPGQPGNLPGSVFLVDSALDGSPAQHGAGFLQGSPQGIQVTILLNGDLNALDGIFHPGFNDPVAGSTFQALTMSLNG
jgi:hypothetical protein